MVSGGLSFPASGYLAVALATEAELREEWTAMRNCLLEYIPACRAGKYRALSFRDRETGERVATVILRKENGGFGVHEARRRFNRPAGGAIATAAERAAAVYTAMVLGQRGRRAGACAYASRRDAIGAGEFVPQAAFDFESA